MVTSLLLALLLATPPRDQAPADAAAKTQAQQLLRDGTRLYRKGQYQEALERFSAAYALFASPKLQFNIGQANRELGRPVEAATAFERFLAEPANAPQATIEEARGSLGELQGQLGQIQVDCHGPDLEVLLDGTIVGRTPLARPLWSKPGRHVVGLRGQGLARFAEPVDVRAGSIATVTPLLSFLRLLPPPVLGRSAPAVQLQRAREPEAAGTWSRLRGRWWFWAAVAGVAVAGGVAAAFAAGSGQDPPPSTLGSQSVFR
jgi:tetratricopeptide (TPR) repeat protein